MFPARSARSETYDVLGGEQTPIGNTETVNDNSRTASPVATLDNQRPVTLLSRPNSSVDIVAVQDTSLRKMTLQSSLDYGKEETA
ncbi:BnaA06g38960D [Brassica napus]|uniref:BnaA06g38960D protein n=1 Tax=Brassica napus TaxID=3708 RepID=A0A078I8Q1_BRANA|nr:BnaA06g38960D [Brassica napus]